MITFAPIKTFKDKRPLYLQAIEQSYKELGYTTKLNGFLNILEVFPKGCIVPETPKTQEEMIIEKWIS